MQMFIVVGMPRTGSTLLQTTLAQHPQIKMYGELFHRVKVEREGPHAINEDGSKIFFDEENDDAIDFLRKNVWNEKNSEYGAVGFKLFGERVDCIGTEKLFLRLREAFPSLKFIHIERSDLLACWVSREAAKKTGQWVDASTKDSAGDKKNVNDLRVTANPIALESFFQSYIEVNSFLRSDFFPKANYLHVDYEQLSSEFETVSMSVFDFLGLPQISVQPATRKQRQLSAEEQIQNIEDVRRYFALSKYAFLVSDSRSKNNQLTYSGLHDAAQKLSTDDWIEYVGQSTEREMTLAGVAMPTAPPAEKQAIFHGNSGASAIQSAAPVYKYVLDICRQQNISSIKSLLDFGCGWGRFTRLFVRDVEEAGLIGIDPWAEALQMCREHMPYAAFVRSQFNPPLAFRDGFFDVVFANSIFSHLSESSALAWIEEIARVLRPGGLLIATTHSKHWLTAVKEFQSGERVCQSDWHQAFKNSKVDIANAIDIHKNGEFVFIPTGNGQDNRDYGDSFVPVEYVRKNWGQFLEFVEFVDDPVRFPQATFTLRKTTA
ncbi:Stf0 family sulfotransferase [Undibacterium macrobrachii]|uniref:Methyltransferase domain-containing protein n=1 Tax=Undibacterium macrobrachii TaxID=1119058 RepID=A0ABQ2XCW2_9BURK|nr:Stf0 family sulfotransferase [Undibacterium macrobrachii]GGX11069.1 hypothetical protein GCM10011282_16740 [Undibacterium macrobrachii]